MLQLVCRTGIELVAVGRDDQRRFVRRLPTQGDQAHAVAALALYQAVQQPGQLRPGAWAFDDQARRSDRVG